MSSALAVYFALPCDQALPLHCALLPLVISELHRHRYSSTTPHPRPLLPRFPLHSWMTLQINTTICVFCKCANDG